MTQQRNSIDRTLDAFAVTLLAIVSVFWFVIAPLPGLVFTAVWVLIYWNYKAFLRREAHIKAVNAQANANLIHYNNQNGVPYTNYRPDLRQPGEYF